MRKLEKYFFYIFVFCLPFQTRQFIFTFIGLGKIGKEFTSAFVYLTDLLVLVFLASWLLDVFRQDKKRTFRFRKVDYIFSLFVGVGAVSSFLGQYSLLSFYSLFKLVQFYLVFVYVRENVDGLGLRSVFKILTLSGTFQGVIALLQFSFQHDLGLKLLQESPLAIRISGVAKIETGLRKYIRAYGTLPHPNILANFLVITLFSTLFFYLLSERNRKLIGPLLISVFVQIGALCMTFSRSILFLGGIGGILTVFIIYKEFGFRKKLKRFTLVAAAVTLFFGGFLFEKLKFRILNLFIKEQPQALSLRSSYNEIAFDFITEHPWLGIGFGNFVPALQQFDYPSWLYQPVHNVYLLIGAEAGIVALLLFIAFLFLAVGSEILRLKKGSKSGFIKVGILVLLGVMFLAMGVDHYLWTLQQGGLMFWLILGLLKSDVYN